MAKPKLKGGPKQKLSPKAAKAKAERDKKTAMTPRRRAMKAENQRKRRASKSSVKGKDYDHNRGKFVSEKVNRSATKTTNNTMPQKKTSKKKPKKILGKTISKKKVTDKRPMSAKTKAAKGKVMNRLKNKKRIR